MNPRRLAVAGIPPAIILLALLLRDAVRDAVIVPAAYLWWLFKMYYDALPQVVFWGALAFAVFYALLSNLVPKEDVRPERRLLFRPMRGEIETLAEILEKSKGGMYYKWLAANRLGKDAREILAQREGSPVSKSFGGLNRDPAWNPPREVEDYLQTGLLGSFADFPRPRGFWQKQPPTPLDADMSRVVEYLESQMESSERKEEI